MGILSIEFHKIWIDQCAAAEGILDRFGLTNALDYLIGEKLYHFIEVAEKDAQWAAELPAFLAEIRRIFTAEEINEYLDYLERTKFFAPIDEELAMYEEEEDDDLWLDNPILGAQELLRFFHMREFLAG